MYAAIAWVIALACAMAALFLAAVYEAAYSNVGRTQIARQIAAAKTRT